jgi:hypothetical protein
MINTAQNDSHSTSIFECQNPDQLSVHHLSTNTIQTSPSPSETTPTNHTNTNSTTPNNMNHNSPSSNTPHLNNPNMTGGVYSTNATGLPSRSNSQPDLTVNLEKLLPNTANYNNYFYNTSCVATSSTPASATLLNNNYPHHPASHYHYQINPGMNNGAGGMGAGPHGRIRRYPSLTFKTPSDPCNNPPENEYFSTFNISDLMNGNVGHSAAAQFSHVVDAGNSSGVFNAASTYSATTSGVSSSSSLTTTSLDDGLLVGIEALRNFDFMNNNSSNFEKLPDLEDLMSLVTFDSATASSDGSSTSNMVVGGNGSGVRHGSAPAAAIEEALIAVAHQHQQQNNSQSGSSLRQHMYGNNSSQAHSQPLMSGNDSNCNNENNNGSNNSQAIMGMNSMSSYFEYSEMDSLAADNTMTGATMGGNDMTIGDSPSNGSERVSRSAPPSPTMEQKKKQKPTSNLQW